MTQKKILIVGGGMAGLSAGCYAQMNGFESHIFEKHAVPGGLCTAWQRQGYTFDVSLHFLTESRSGGLHQLWRELGVLVDRKLIDHETGGVIEIGGRRFTQYPDLDQCRAEMIRFAPADEKPIREMIALARSCTRVSMSADKPQELMSLLESLSYMVHNWPVVRLWQKYSKLSLAEYATRFSDPALRELIAMMETSPSWPMPDFPAAIYILMLAMRHLRNASYCIGGSFQVSQSVAQRYADLGGTLHLRAPVAKILVENDRAVGVRLADGKEERGDYVISAADGRTTIWQMLEGRYLSEEICRKYREWKVYPPLVQVMIGVNRDLSAEPFSQSLPLAQPILIAGRERTRMDILHTCFDPTLAPAGKSAVQVWYTTEWEYWEKIARDRAAYDAEKAQIADTILAELEKVWPGFRALVEVVDVPTPVTYRRYTGNEQGSPDGWCITTRNGMRSLANRLPGLGNFYMAGQWTLPFSGVPGAVQTGRHAVMFICRDERRTFTAALPRVGWRPEHVAPPTSPARTPATAPAPSEGQAHVQVDAERCNGCGDCEYEAPEVFAMGTDGKARVLRGSLTPQMIENVRRAMNRCPDHAISLDGVPTPGAQVVDAGA